MAVCTYLRRFDQFEIHVSRYTAEALIRVLEPYAGTSMPQLATDPMSDAQLMFDLWAAVKLMVELHPCEK